MLIEVNPGDYTFPNATCIGVYDGDTLYLDIDMGFSMHRSNRNRAGRLKKGYRLLDIDAPEIAALKTRQKGTEARDYLASLVIGKSLLVRTFENPDHDQDDSFGRYLAWIRVFDDSREGLDVNRTMLDSKHAVPFSR